MSDQQQIPAPLLDNLRWEAEYKAVAEGAASAIKELDRQIAKVQADRDSFIARAQVEIERLSKERDEADGQRTGALEHANLHRGMVTGICEARGWPVPELPAAPPAGPQITPEDPLNLNGTGALPIPPEVVR